MHDTSRLHRFSAVVFVSSFRQKNKKVWCMRKLQCMKQ